MVIEPEKSSLDSLERLSVPDSKTKAAIEMMEPARSIGDTPEKNKEETKKPELSEKKSKAKSAAKK